MSDEEIIEEAYKSLHDSMSEESAVRQLLKKAISLTRSSVYAEVEKKIDDVIAAESGGMGSLSEEQDRLVGYYIGRLRELKQSIRGGDPK